MDLKVGVKKQDREFLEVNGNLRVCRGDLTTQNRALEAQSRPSVPNRCLRTISIRSDPQAGVGAEAGWGCEKGDHGERACASEASQYGSGSTSAFSVAFDPCCVRTLSHILACSLRARQ